MFVAALLIDPPPKKTTNTYNMDQSLKHTEWEKSYTRVHTVWFHFYEGLEQGKLIYGEKKTQQWSTGGRCVVGHWLGWGMKEISAVMAIFFIMWASYSL